MATAFSHAIVAVAIGTAWSPSKAPLKLWLFGVGCAVVPDVDIFGFWLGIPYEDLLGHRGLTHSLAFAAVLSGLVVATAFRGAQLGRLLEARLNREISTEAEERELVVHAQTATRRDARRPAASGLSL